MEKKFKCPKCGNKSVFKEKLMGVGIVEYTFIQDNNGNLVRDDNPRIDDTSEKEIVCASCGTDMQESVTDDENFEDLFYDKYGATLQKFAQKYLVLFDGDEYSAPEAEFYTGKADMSDDEVIKAVIEQSAKEGVVYTEDEAVKVILI